MLLAEFAATAARPGSGIGAATVALITGGSAILGALVGGGVAGWLNLRGQRSRQEFDRRERLAAERREDALRHHQVRGVAREMRSGLKRTADLFKLHRNGGFWWSDQLPGPEIFDRERDRVLLASFLTVDQWDTIELAEEAIRIVMVTRDLALLRPRVKEVPVEKHALEFDWDDDNPSLGPLYREYLEAAEIAITGAVDALGPTCERSLISIVPMDESPRTPDAPFPDTA